VCISTRNGQFSKPERVFDRTAEWDEALQRLFETVRDGLIVIDEFPI